MLVAIVHCAKYWPHIKEFLVLSQTCNQVFRLFNFTLSIGKTPLTTLCFFFFFLFYFFNLLFYLYLYYYILLLLLHYIQFIIKLYHSYFFSFFLPCRETTPVINRVELDKGPSHTEIFSKMRKIYSRCYSVLIWIKNCYRIRYEFAAQ